MVCGGSQWCVVVVSGVWWQSVVCGGSRWCVVVYSQGTCFHTLEVTVSLTVDILWLLGRLFGV